MPTYLSSIFPEVFEIDPTELKPLYITKDNIHNVKNTIYVSVFWAHYREELLYCEVDYEFDFLEGYDDWSFQVINILIDSPGEEELSHLLQYKIRYHLVVPEMLKYEQVRLNLSQWEEDIITTWNRDKKINDIFK